MFVKKLFCKSRCFSFPPPITVSHLPSPFHKQDTAGHYYLPLPASSPHFHLYCVHFSYTLICTSSFTSQTNSALREKEYYYASFRDKETTHLEATRKRMTYTKASACSVWSRLHLTCPMMCWRRAAQDRGKARPRVPNIHLGSQLVSKLACDT